MSDWNFPHTGPILLDLSLASGRVEIDTVENDHIEITADNPEKLTVDYTGSTITIRQPRFSQGSVRVKASIPMGSDVDVSVGSADVFVAPGCAEVEVKGGSGDVRVGNARRVRVAAASGDIRIATVEEDVSVSGASGDVLVDSVGGDLAVSVASGDVRIGHVAGSTSVSTAAGDVRVRSFHGSVVELKSLSGDLQIGLPTGIRVEADIKTLVGRVTLPEPSERNESPDHIVRLKARTTSGDIRIERA